MNKFFAILIFGILFFLTYVKAANVIQPQSGSNLSGLASSGVISNLNNTRVSVLNCQTNKYEMFGPKDMKIDKIGEYSVSANQEYANSVPSKIEYKLFKGAVQVKSFVGEKFDYSFVQTGNYNLQALIHEENGCEYLVTKDVRVYNYFLMYIGDFSDELDLGFESNFNRNSIAFGKILLSNKTFFSEKDFNERLNENAFFIKNADFLIVDTTKFNNVFEQIGLYSKSMSFDLSNKKIYVVNDLNQNLFKRLIAKYLKNLGIIRINVVSKSDFLNFFSALSKNGINYTNGSYVKVFTVSFDDVSKYRIFSFIIDYLLYNGFPTNLIALFLALAVCALIVSIFKQIIGFSVFSIYSPLLFAVSMLVLGVKFSFILLLIAFISTSITRYFTKKIYLLYSAKMSMLIILYILVTIITLWLDSFLKINIIDYSIFNNSLILFPIIILIVVADKIFYEGFNVFSKNWLVLFGEFLIVSFSVYFLISSYSFQYFLLAFPELLILIFLLNIIVGRFTGLQLLEYFRFMPLIKRTLEEEEE